MPTNSPAHDALLARYSDWDDERLLAVAAENCGGYTEDAIVAARQVLLERGLADESGRDLERLFAQVDQRLQVERDARPEPEPGMVRRWFAYHLDGILLVLLTGIVMLPLFDDIGEGPSQHVFCLFISILILSGLVFLFRDSFRGASPGRFITGICVRTEAEPRCVPHVGALALRNLFMLLWSIEAVVMLARKDHRRIGDLLTGTRVVWGESRPKRWRRAGALLGLGIVLGGSLLLGVAHIVKGLDAYAVAIEHIQADEELKEELGGIESFGFMPSGAGSMGGGHGSVSFVIKVIGRQGNRHVQVDLAKEPGQQWTVVGRLRSPSEEATTNTGKTRRGRS